MDFFHIKILENPKSIFSIVYSVQPNISHSHFVNVNDHGSDLFMPGMNPPWIDEVFDIQKKDTKLARGYVFNMLYQEKINKKHSISIGFDWDISCYKL